MSSNVFLKKLAWSLSIAGLVPFVGLAAVLLMEHPSGGLAYQALIAYAMVILSFLGAIHWGAVLQRGRNDDSAIQLSALLWGVIPSLWAWATIFFSPSQQPLWLIVGLLIALAIDTLFYPRHGLALWMLPVRLVATVGASTSLILVALYSKF
jgi:Protein of unknown function (DUF3429)